MWNPDGENVHTQYIEDNLNPIYYEALEIYYDLDCKDSIQNNKGLTQEQLETAAPIIFDMWDYDDGFLDGNDFLGRSIINLSDAAISFGNKIPTPKWHDIKINVTNPKETANGHVLCSFSIVDDDYIFDTELPYLDIGKSIEVKEYQIDLNVLGLRELQSTGLLPVKQAFVKFNIKSLLPP